MIGNKQASGYGPAFNYRLIYGIELTLQLERISMRDLMLEGFQAGLLHAIVSCVIHPSSTSLTTPTLQCLRRWLGACIPESLVYHSVLSVFITEFRGVESAVQTERFRESAVFEVWKELEDLFNIQVVLFNNYNSREYGSWKACDSAIVHDWKNGGHRESCQDHREARSKMQLQHLTATDRSFLRIVLRNDYSAVRASVFLKQISFLSANPSKQLYVLCEYQGCYFSADVRPVSDNPGLPVEEWEDYVSRAQQSGGRMELHVVVIGSAPNLYTMIMPLRSDDGRVHEGLKHIASSGQPEDWESNIAQLIVEQDEEFFNLGFQHGRDASAGKVRFGSGSGYFFPNAERERRVRFRHFPNPEPEPPFTFGSAFERVRTSATFGLLRDANSGEMDEHISVSPY
ncbi:hypothetical protein C8R46DRAFT_1037706 [Mycena filopes]|nr:hypothetical protein C8R46DRAFT_1037706 [Mycena filopes]